MIDYGQPRYPCDHESGLMSPMRQSDSNTVAAHAHKTTRSEPEGTGTPWGSELYGTQTGVSPEGPADALNRLTRFRRGTLDGNKTDLSTTVFEQDWHDTAGVLKLDTLGNWDAVRIDPDGDDTASSMTTTTRGHNAANEVAQPLSAGDATTHWVSAYDRPARGAQVPSAYDHDDNGNLMDDETYTFHYDWANHLVCAVKQTTGDTVGEYVYDALGRRVKKVVDDVSDTLDGTTLYYYDGLRVIEKGELDESADYVATHQFVWGLYLDGLLVYDYDDDADGDFDAIDEQNGDKRYYALQDFIYSTAAVIDSTGTVQERYDYRPYGKVTFWNAAYTSTQDETVVHNDVLFTGQLYDPETALYHYKARAFHATLGRLLQRDAIAHPTAANLYAYVRSSPTTAIDPLGLTTEAASRPTTQPTSRPKTCKKCGLKAGTQFTVSKSERRAGWARNAVVLGPERRLVDVYEYKKVLTYEAQLRDETVVMPDGAIHEYKPSHCEFVAYVKGCAYQTGIGAIKTITPAGYETGAGSKGSKSFVPDKVIPITGANFREEDHLRTRVSEFTYLRAGGGGYVRTLHHRRDWHYGVIRNVFTKEVVAKTETVEYQLWVLVGKRDATGRPTFIKWE